MFVRCLSLYVQREYPLLPNSFYEKLAGHYHLPTLNALLATLCKNVIWPDNIGYEVYYLENIREQSDKTVRFLMSIENNLIIHLSVQFPTCGDRIDSSLMIGYLTSLINKLEITSDDINLVIEGYTECNFNQFIRETNLSSFTFHNPLSRYFHISERPTTLLPTLTSEQNKPTWRSMLIAYL